MPRWISIPLPDGTFTIADAARRLDVSTQHVRRLVDEGTLERVEHEGCPQLVSESSLLAYEKKREKPGDERVLTLVPDGFMTPEAAACFLERPIENVYMHVGARRLTSKLTSHGFLVIDRQSASFLKLELP